jgi:hypothetical protein
MHQMINTNVSTPQDIALQAAHAEEGTRRLYMSVTPVSGTPWDDLNPAWREIFRMLFSAAQATATVAMGGTTTTPLLPDWQTTTEEGRAYTKGIARRGDE